MRLSQFLLLFLGILCFSPAQGEPAGNLDDRSVAELEAELASIKSELGKLALWGMNSATGSNGDRSGTHSDGDHEEWFEVTLDKEYEIDQIVLVPHITRDSKEGLRSDGFPFELKILAGKQGDPEGKVIGEYSRSHAPHERIGPVVITTPSPETASWIRVVAVKLSPRGWDGLYNLQLSEIMIFSREREVGLNSSVLLSSESRGNDKSRSPAYLVDGFTPYFMYAGKGTSSIAFLEDNLPDDLIPILTIDLGEIKAVDRVHIHPLELSDNIPLNSQMDLGIPRRVEVVGATSPDFSDAVALVEMDLANPFHTGPIIMRRIQQTECR